MSRFLTQGDEIWVYLCSWCGRGVKESEITETPDGSGLCFSCIVHYNPDYDEPDNGLGFTTYIED